MKSSRIHRAATACYTLSTILLAPIAAPASSGGPPNALTNAPGEANCTACHTSFPLNSGPGTYAISAPATYASGDTLSITVSLAQTGQQRWGFEITVLNSANQPVGQIIVTEPARTQLSTAGSGRQYIKHTSAGTDNGTQNAAPGWTFKWVAPDPGAGTVTFWGTGNAANGNGNNQGDYIYSANTSVNQGDDTDFDGVPDGLDNCPAIANPLQENADGDGTGDVCDDCTDLDGDGFGNPGYAANTCATDNCPTVPNPLQEDTDGDGIGDSCEVTGCTVAITGDVNESGTLTSADIIFEVNFVFKGGATPQPCQAAGDVNCNGSVTSADIIYLVNHVFKGGDAPCDVCTLIPATWTCP
jgi:hypothetical protein